MQKITSRGQWELYLASIASAYDGKDSNPSLYSMNEANNFRYKVIIKNLTKGTEIQDYVTDVKLAPNRTSSKIQSSKATFSLTENIISHGDSMEIFVRNISETFEIKILSGKAKLENTVLNNYQMLSMNVAIIDEVENLYSKIVPEDTFVFDNYLNNDNDKNNSIYHIIMRKLGFSDTELEIENIVNSNGSLVRIPFMLFKEGNRWIDELFTALDSIGARIFITPEGKVRIENGVDKREPKPIYEFTKNNILNSFETRVIYPDKNGSKIIYDNYRYLENQIIFGLAEKIEVKVGITPESNQKAMRIKYVSDIAKSYNLTKAEGYWYPGEDASSLERVQLKEGVHYKFEELKSSGAVVKFFNPFSKLFYIDTFEISGIPLVKYDGNEYVFKNKDIIEKNDENFQSYQNNKYIQEEPLAAEVGKIIFLDKCKENTEYSFKCNFVPFLDIGDICTLDFLGKNELVRVVSIEHSLGRERGCTSNIKAQKVIFLTDEEYKNSSLESLNVSTSFLELKNLKEEIKNVEDEFKESEAWITGKIGAKAWITEEEPVGDIKNHDVWYKESTNEFKIWMNGKWNPAAEEDIMPSLKSWIATQTAQLEMGKIIEQVGDDANSAYERAGIFLMNNDEKFGSMNGAIAEVSIDKNARILAKNVNNLLEFNTKDPTNPNVMTSKILMGVYDVNDAKHKDTAFQVGDEENFNYLKYDHSGNLKISGEAEIVSKGINETTIIKGGSISFTRNGTAITTFRNMKSGSVTTDGSGYGYVDFTGMSRSLHILCSIKGVNVSSNIRTLNCRYEADPSFVAENRYRFYIYGTEENYTNDHIGKVQSNSWTSPSAYTAGVTSIQQSVFSPNHVQSGVYRGFSIQTLESGIIEFSVSIDGGYIGKYTGAITPISFGWSQTNNDVTFWVPTYAVNVLTGGATKTTSNKTQKTVTVSAAIVKPVKVRMKFMPPYNYPEVTKDVDISTSITGSTVLSYTYSTSSIQNIVGSGDVMYIAMEV